MTLCRRSHLIRALAAVCAAAALPGCGGPGTVERAELEEQVQTQLSRSVGQQAPKASCPDELRAEKGASTRCSMSFPDGRLGITVTVSSVSGDTVRFDIKADEQLK